MFFAAEMNSTLQYAMNVLIVLLDACCVLRGTNKTGRRMRTDGENTRVNAEKGEGA